MKVRIVRRSFLAVAMSMVLWVSGAWAVPMEYTFSGEVGFGELEGVILDASQMTVKLRGDTNNVGRVFASDPDFLFVPTLQATFLFTGITDELFNPLPDMTFVYPDPVAVYVRHVDPLLTNIGIGLVVNNTLENDLLTFNFSGSLNGYDLTTARGPLSAYNSLLSINVADNFIIDSLWQGEMFQAAPVPEPSTFVLFGSALGGVLLLRRRACVAKTR